MTGIDISKYQSAIPPGTWDFVFARATHDATGVDPLFETHFPNALTRSARRGAYHFANPSESSGAAQATHFAQVCLANGFNKYVDLWALDFEEGALGSHAANVAWIREFMATVTALLGARGLLYVGWPYFVESCGVENVALLHEHPWWLPAYGPNDGQPHSYQAPFVPCVHQYTSRGGPNRSGLDLDRVLDTATWAHLLGSSPAPVPKPKPVPLPQPITITTGDTMKHTDTTVKLGAQGEGYFDLPGVSDADVHSALVIGTPDPAAEKKYAPIPRVSFTLSQPKHVDRFVIEGGAPGATVTVRVAHE